MPKKFISMIIMVVLSLGAQAQDDKKCPENPSEFRGKEDDCFDCLEGALSNLKLFVTEVGKMLDNKKLTSAEEAKSMKTRSDGLWDGVEGWEKICEKKPEAETKTEGEAKPKAETEAEVKPEAETEAEGEAKPEAETGAETEAGPEPET